MKIILIGANGTVGKYVFQALNPETHEIIRVGRSSGDFRADLKKPESIAELYHKIGPFDALVCTAGEVSFAPLQSITVEQWNHGLQSKLLGQINLVQQGIPLIRDRGSFTLISGVLSEQFILGGTSATLVNRALEGFVQSAACELPRGLRVNVVSPTLLKDSVEKYGDSFPGFVPVEGEKVGQAFKRSVFGIQTGQIYRVV